MLSFKLLKLFVIVAHCGGRDFDMEPYAKPSILEDALGYSQAPYSLFAAGDRQFGSSHSLPSCYVWGFMVLVSIRRLVIF